jgi:hypothetical protein
MICSDKPIPIRIKTPDAQIEKTTFILVTYIIINYIFKVPNSSLCQNSKNQTSSQFSNLVYFPTFDFSLGDPVSISPLSSTLPDSLRGLVCFLRGDLPVLMVRFFLYIEMSLLTSQMLKTNLTIKYGIMRSVLG